MPFFDTDSTPETQSNASEAELEEEWRAGEYTRRLNISRRPHARRIPFDYYATPPWATRAFLRHEQAVTSRVWEPACGEQHLSNVMRAAGLDVTSSDIIARKQDIPAVDFLMLGEAESFAEQQGGFDWIVTNPPFALAELFVATAAKITPRFVMFCRLQFLETPDRAAMFRRHGLARVWVHANRVSCWPNGIRPPGRGKGMAAMAWFVFDAAGASWPPAVDFILDKDPGPE